MGKNNQRLPPPSFRETWGLGKRKEGGSLRADGWVSFIYPLAKRPVEIHSADLSCLPQCRDAGREDDVSSLHAEDTVPVSACLLGEAKHAVL